jgi:hypothetical protein
MTTMIASDVLQHAADPTELDARIVAAFVEDAKSVDVSRLLPEVGAAANAADAAAGEARARALDPLLSRDEVKLARREMEDAAFTRDRLHEAGTKLAERVEALKALEADRRLQAEHERVSAERDRLAEEMERMAEPIVKIAHTVSRIAICDREIGRLNATSTAKYGHIPLVLSGAAWSGTPSLRSRDCRRQQLCPVGQARRTNCTSSDQPVRQAEARSSTFRGPVAAERTLTQVTEENPISMS